MPNYRYENKYIIDEYTAELLKIQLKSLMKLDSHSLNDDVSYEIRSLYYDDLENTAYYDKVNGVEFRSKYRLRMYNNDPKTVKLECKYKDDNMTRKVSCKMSQRNSKYLINKEYEKIKFNNTLYKKFIRDIKYNNLLPYVIVDYSRLALTYPVNEVRITFDSKLKSSNDINSFFEDNINRTDCFNTNQIVLEVKYNMYLPDTLQMVLNQYNLNSCAISKFATCVDYL